MVEVGALRLHAESYPVPVLVVGMSCSTFSLFVQMAGVSKSPSILSWPKMTVVTVEPSWQRSSPSRRYWRRCRPRPSMHPRCGSSLPCPCRPLVVGAIDVHRHVGRAAHLLGRCHASALIADEGGPMLSGFSIRMPPIYTCPIIDMLWSYFVGSTAHCGFRRVPSSRCAAVPECRCCPTDR